MAIQATITHKGIELKDVYIKASIIGISERMADEGKTFWLQYGYAIKKDKASSAFDNGQGSVQCEPDCNVYAAAYADIASRFKLQNEKV